MLKNLYPLKFHPILKDKIWGGQKLRAFNKQSDGVNIGESWEISDLEDDVSIVSNGVFSGLSLKQLIKTHKGDLLGLKNYALFGDKFPLLIKFIDAESALSVQLHPNDALAKERHNAFGKTEMWYVMQADTNANLIIDFKEQIDAEIYLKHLNDKRLPEILNYENVSEGDAFFIKVGRVHAIGAGVLLAEIQQTSDITYRIYDWDRTDDQGNYRTLHTDLAIDAINFKMPNDFKKHYSNRVNTSNDIVNCQYFKTAFLPIEGKVIKHNIKDSFYIYMCVDGEASIVVEDLEVALKQGETALVPACVKDYEIYANKAKLLEVYV
ncbi:MAG: class I mannose-6-phosphate isomerase [Flavobacteriaceae bacterium]|nr:class I mannose-6-phosphate isomerase [Flavobacteriaceae bacterium]